MSETHEKRARAQNKKLKHKDKAERKKLRREPTTPQPSPEVLEARYFYDQERNPS